MGSKFVLGHAILLIMCAIRRAVGSQAPLDSQSDLKVYACDRGHGR
jgi:hypothetical protein